MTSSKPTSRFVAGLACAPLLAACSSSSMDASGPPEPPPIEFGGDRPVTLQVPDGYDPAKPAPLLVMLHGYQSSGLVQELYLKLGPEALARGYLYLTPDGTVDATGARFWNDWPGDHGGATVDDVGYLTKLLADVRAAYTVDPGRIFFTGHSNGGAMTYRMACALSDTLAGVAILAGDMPVEPATVCKPSGPLHVLHVHGDEDPAVTYATNAKNLGAEDCFGFWSEHAGCTGKEAVASLDLTNDEAGAETEVTRATGCAQGSAELWKIVGAGHLPGFGPNYVETLFDYFDAHPR